MLGYDPPTPIEERRTKRLRLLVENLDNIVSLLKDELNAEDKNIVDVSSLIEKIQREGVDDTQYYEEDDDE
jgi:hypothetical protein